jgi:TonB family protein
MFHEGQKIGSYKLLTKIGKGGFGEVWLAEKRSELVTKKVAVKLPLEDQVNLETIKQEAELWEQASGHANVLPIIDADIIDGQVLIVSEYAEGGSLHDKLRREGKLSIKQAVEMTVGILNGLEFLHNKRIIHRDIKPQNILLQGDTPRLADFGISRAMQTVAISSTIIGTDSYMSPETFEGKRSIQTDIWAVGVVLYQLLKGSLPFPQEHPSERMFAIIQKDFEPLPVEIPFNLQQIIKKALAKLPENRFESASQMRNDLQHFVSSIQSTGNVQNQPTEVLLAETMPSPKFVASIPSKNPSVATVVTPQFVQYVEPQGNQVTNKNNNSLWVAFGAVALVFVGIIGGTGFYVWNNSRQSETAKVSNTNTSVTNSDSDSTILDSNSDSTILDSNSDSTILDSNSDSTSLNSNSVSTNGIVNSNKAETFNNANSTSKANLKTTGFPTLKPTNTTVISPTDLPTPKPISTSDYPTPPKPISTPDSPSQPTPTPAPTPKTTPTPAPKITGPVAGGVVNGKALSLPRPTYPAAAKAVRAEGTVSVQVVIDEDGNVTSATATSGHPLLRAAAEQAARSAKFNPTVLSGQKVKVLGIVTYNFVAQ